MSRMTMLKARSIVGDRVKNAAGENLGNIEDLVIDPATGRIAYVIVSFGGMLAGGERLHAIPWSYLRPSLQGDYLIFDGDRDFIQRAPAFDRRNWPDMDDRFWQDRVRDYYPAAAPAPVRERVVVDRGDRLRQRGVGFGAALGVVVLVGLLVFAYLAATRGWESARDTVVEQVEGVAHAARETSEDAALTAKVKTALALSRRVPAATINVDSNDGAVTLNGEVQDEETRRLAEMIAMDTAGVARVNNNLVVNASSVAADEIERMQNRVTDLETKFLVHDALSKDPGLTGTDIQIEVQDGIATLSGAVRTADQKYLAGQTASSIEGVRSVNNQLRVNALEGF